MTDRVLERILVDTNVVSYLFNDHPLAGFFRPYLVGVPRVVCFVTIAELYYGAYHANWGAARLSRLGVFLADVFVLPYDRELCLRWADLKHASGQSGITMDDTDCWVAASALLYRCALATNNARYFRHIEALELISPGTD